jgi:hypothetical protein
MWDMMLTGNYTPSQILKTANNKWGFRTPKTKRSGGYELDRLSRLNKLQKYTIYYQYRLDAEGKLERTDKMGWNTNSATRPVMLEGVRELINNQLVVIYDEPTLTEGFSFVKHKTPSGWKAEAEVGANDDLIMALAGVWQLYQTENPPPIRRTRTRQRPPKARFHV